MTLFLFVVIEFKNDTQDDRRTPTKCKMNPDNKKILNAYGLTKRLICSFIETHWCRETSVNAIFKGTAL